jgi:phospholipase C
VREPNISEWRRQTFGNLTSALHFGDFRSVSPALLDTSGPLQLAEYESSVLPRPSFPTGVQKLPEQEKSPTWGNFE